MLRYSAIRLTSMLVMMVLATLVVFLIGVSAPTFWLAFIMQAVFYGGL